MKQHPLKVERELRGWSQAKVAEAVGTNVRTIIRWEQGQTLPHPYYREQLCALFGKTVRELGLLGEFGKEDQAQEAPPLSTHTTLFDQTIPLLLGDAARLVGRETILAQAKQRLLEHEYPLNALQGLPGSGKTTLASALAIDQAVREHFRDGILWAGLGQEPDVLGHLARWGRLLELTPVEVEEVNSRESWGRALRRAIGQRHLLLIIDDAWSIDDAQAFQVGGSQCAYLLTTRLPHVAFAFAKEGTLLVAELEEEHGLALLARFVPQLVEQDRENARALVNAVGGLPLALTLMGSYLAAQAFTGQARRLQAALKHLQNIEERLRLSIPLALNERAPHWPADIPLSLQAAIAVSDLRLEASSRAVLRALALFPPKPNSFSEEAALAVSAEEVNTLDALWDTGLLESSGPGRYTLHKTIADYAHAQGNEKEARQRLVNYMLWYLQAHAQDYEALEREQANILAALDMAEAPGQAQLLAQGVTALIPFMRVRGHYALADRLLQRALQIAVESGDRERHIETLHHLAAFAELRGDYASAEQSSQEGLRLARQAGKQIEAESALLTTLGLVTFHRGNYSSAKSLFDDGLRLARRSGNQERICTLLLHLGSVLHYQGRYPQAEALYQEALALARHIGQHELITLLLTYLGAVTRSQGNTAAAEHYYLEGLTLARSMGHRGHLSFLLNNAGVIAFQRGQLTLATNYYQEGLTLVQQVGHRAQICLFLSNLGNVAAERCNYAQAERYLREGIELARQLENRNYLTDLLMNLGSTMGHQDDYAGANSCFQESLELARSLDSPHYIHSVLIEWGEIHLLFRQFDAAFAAFTEVCSAEQETQGEPELMAAARYGLARIAALRGEMAEARLSGQESLRLFRSIGHRKVREVTAWLQSLPSTDSISAQ